MIKRCLSAAILILSLFLITLQAQEATISQQDATRPDKQETIAWMNKIGQMPEKQQNENLDVILRSASDSDSKTPRSDFLFCVGLAHLGNGKAQQCLGRAYEKGRGIVEDLMESYTWFALSTGNNTPGSDADLERVKTRLLSTYPAPTDEEFENQVSDLKNRISQYQAAVKKSKK
jgi:TPR repeat protein